MNLPAGQRQDCMTLMNDPDARTQGSVDGGGIIRETTITIPGQPLRPLRGVKAPAACPFPRPGWAESCRTACCGWRCAP
jgi:hypothetical protein